LTSDVVNGVVRMALYADETRAILPDMLRRSRLGDHVGLAAMAVSTVDTMEGTIHAPVNVAVLCAEDVPFLAAADHRPDAAFNDERPSMKGSCTGISPVAKPFRPTSITPPTLLLSGEFDPITPPHHARRVEPIFAVKRHLVVRGHGHNMLPRGCMPGVVADTLVALETGKTIDSVDVTCLEKLQAFPVFVDAMGPAQ
jgi:pimeloyl-ACP methyl ester carboxylesterase